MSTPRKKSFLSRRYPGQSKGRKGTLPPPLPKGKEEPQDKTPPGPSTRKTDLLDSPGSCLLKRKGKQSKMAGARSEACGVRRIKGNKDRLTFITAIITGERTKKYYYNYSLTHRKNLGTSSTPVISGLSKEENLTRETAKNWSGGVGRRVRERDPAVRRKKLKGVSCHLGRERRWVGTDGRG